MEPVKPIQVVAQTKPRRKWLPGLRRGELWYYFGPAFVASVAYIDPGNFATNIEGGSRFGYSLLWVILWSNFMAMLVSTSPPSSALPRQRACRKTAGRTTRSG
jgi:manganese transport protein